MPMEANEYMLEHKDGTPPASGAGAPKNRYRDGEENQGTLVLDATCASVNIRYPQDVSLLNEAREKLETVIYRFCKAYGLKLPGRYARAIRKDYLKFIKAKKNSRQKIRKAPRRQLSYVARDIKYLDGFLAEGYAPTPAEAGSIMAIFKLYGQQKYIYDNKVHSVKHRTVSIRQPWIRPIVRGKVKILVEFGAKLDPSLDGEGYARIERLSFEAYNESGCLQEAVERFKGRTGHYPVRVLADQIYRTRENRRYCKGHGIRLSGPKTWQTGKNGK